MNGGIPIEIKDTEYPIILEVPSFDEIHDSIEANDPNLKYLEHQIAIHQSELGVAKAMSLPKLEAGYHYQSVLGQTFNGAHLGVSIPLWQQKNTIKAEKSFVQHASFQFEEHKLEHFYGIKEQYEDYLNAKQTLEEYQEVLNSINCEELLLKSLELGEIDYITYSLDIQYYYTAYDQLLAIEKDYQLAVAQLFKYQL
jgi:outer membrane protein TolC